MSSECLAGRPYPRDTRETQLSPSDLTLRIPIMCKAHASFRGCLDASYLRNLFSLQLLESSHSLSNTQPFQWNPTIKIEYKRLNNITNKFGTEYKPTKHNVVNNNFTMTMTMYHRPTFWKHESHSMVANSQSNYSKSTSSPTN